jgi:gamma-glutamyltranspeptidase / glutathione hydrolase
MSNTHRGEPGAGREPICFEYRETAPAKATAPMITGSPGGRTIISTVVCVLVNTLEYGMPLREAINAPRLHHGWFPDVVLFEGATDPASSGLITELAALGHQIQPKPHRQGSANSIWIDSATGVRERVADRRRGKAAAQ